MIDYQYIRHYDYSGMRTAPLCIDGHTKGTVCSPVGAVGTPLLGVQAYFCHSVPVHQ